MALSKTIKQAHIALCKRVIAIRLGKLQPDIADLLPTFSQRLLLHLQEVLCEAGLSAEVAFAKTWDVLESKDLGRVPYVRISCLMYAAMAKLASQGKKTPAKHPFNDTDMISAYLPYCDAMFIDREMHNILLQKPLPDEIVFGAKVFSPKTKQGFFEYLDGIETTAPQGHLDIVREIYGAGWETPYVAVIQEM